MDFSMVVSTRVGVGFSVFNVVCKNFNHSGLKEFSQRIRGAGKDVVDELCVYAAGILLQHGHSCQHLHTRLEQDLCHAGDSHDVLQGQDHVGTRVHGEERHVARRFRGV